MPPSFLPLAERFWGGPSFPGAEFATDKKATYRDFSVVVEYDTAALASLIKVPVETLTQADFFAIDGNNTGTVFESSVWTFYDNDNVPLVVTHSAGAGPSGQVLAETF